MKFIIVILPILISLSLFASLRDEKCEKIINSKKAPSWIKNTAKLVKVNGNYYFEAVGKSKKAHNLEFSVYASSDLAKRGIIKVMRKYFKIIEDYTSSAILKYDYHKINKVFKTKIKIVECWEDVNAGDFYTFLRLDIKFMNEVLLNEKLEIHQEIIDEVNLIEKPWGELTKYPKRKHLKLTAKPDWAKKNIYILKNKIYVVGVSKVNGSYDMAKSMSSDEARISLSGLFKLQVTINMEKDKGSSGTSINTSNKTPFLSSKLVKRWIDVKNDKIYSLLEADIDYINKKNDNVLTGELLEILKSYSLNKVKTYTKAPIWIKDDIKIIEKNAKKVYRIVGYSSSLGDLSMTIKNAKDDAFQKIIFSLTKAEEKMKDKDGKALSSYKFSVSLNIAAPIVTEQWVVPKTKDVYVIIELNKSLIDKYNK